MLQRHYRLCTVVGFMLFIVPACTVERQPGDKTVKEIFENPTAFNNQRVAVVGYFEFGGEDSQLAERPPRREGSRIWVERNAIWVDLGWRSWYSKRLADRYIRVVGTLHYRPEHVVIEPRETGDTEVVLSDGFGPSGTNQAELADIRSARPVK